MEGRPQGSATVVTIGHSTRTVDEFSGLLRSAGVTLLADVRRFPYSPRHPRFGEEHLSGELRASRVVYAHLPGLGGRRRPRPGSPNGGWRNPSFRGYADHMETPEFRAAFDALLDLCGQERVCLMCSEAVWWRCHRRLISDALLVRGLPVEHILGERQRSPHALTPWAEVLGKGAEARILYPPEAPARRTEPG